MDWLSFFIGVSSFAVVIIILDIIISAFVKQQSEQADLQADLAKQVKFYKALYEEEHEKLRILTTQLQLPPYNTQDQCFNNKGEE